MAKLSEILVAQAGLPAQVESQQPALPKVSTTLISLAASVPEGPELPLDVMAAPVLPIIPAMPGAPTPAVATRAGGSPVAARALGVGARGTL